MKTKLLIILGIILSNFSFAQIQIPNDAISMTEYLNFYTQTVNKLNNVILNKANYYGQPLSVFLQDLNQNNIIIKNYDPGPYSNKHLKLSFIWDLDTVINIGKNNNYVEPFISISFKEPFIYQQAKTIMNNGYHSYWNPQAENFFKNLIIDKIEFWYVRGLTDNTANPK